MSHTFPRIEHDIAGDYVRVEFTVEEGGSPKDITGATVGWALFDAPPHYTDGPVLDDSDGDVTVSISDASAGRVDVELGSDATTGLSGTVHHRIRVTDAGGNRQTWLGQHELTDTDVDTS